MGGLLGTLATVISAIVLIGYWYGTPLLYGGNVIPVALSTGWAFFLSGISILPPPELRSGRCALFWANQPARFYFAPLPGYHRRGLG